MDIVLNKVSQIAVRFVYSIPDCGNQQQNSHRIRAAPAPLFKRRNPGFTLAAIMGKTAEEEVIQSFSRLIIFQFFPLKI